MTKREQERLDFAAALGRYTDRLETERNREFAPPAQDADISVTQTPIGFYAIDYNNYDVDCDHTGFFTKSPTGYGRTPLDAIVDLLDNTEEG